MKVIINESEHGLEYAWEVVSACEKAGIQCIADERPNGEILFYDPKGKKYATDKDLMDADAQIWDLFGDNGKKTDLYDEVMLDAVGKDFEKFSVKWNANQKQVGEKDIMATKNCSRIIGNYNETRIVGKRKPSKEFLDKVEQFKKRWRSIGKPKADDEEDYVDDFGDRVNGIEAQVSEGDESDDWSSNEDEVEIQWMIDDKELGIESGEIETVVIDLDLVDCFEELVYQVELALEKAHGGMRFDYDDEWILVDEVELIKRFGCSMLESESNGRTFDDPRDWSASEGEVEIMWTRDFPECGIESGDTDHFVVDYDLVLPNEYDMESNCLKEEVCNLIRKEYPDLDFDETDFDITNEREFWGDEAIRHIYPYDECDI